MVESRDLTFFVAVAEELHFARAAARLHIVPAAVTARIQQLEAELGVRLFDRSSRRVALTPAGRQLLGPARNSLQSLAAISDLATSLARGSTGHARISLAPNLGGIGARLVTELVAALPGLETVATSTWSADGLRSLIAGDVVAAVVRGPVEHPDLASTAIGEYHDGYVAVSARDPLAEQGAVSLAAFQSRPFLITERALAPAVHDQTVAYFAQHGVAPVWRHHRLLGYDEVAPFVAAGYAASLIHSHLSTAELPGISVRRLVEPAPTHQVKIAWRAADRSPLSRFLAERTLPEAAGSRASASAPAPRQWAGPG